MSGVGPRERGFSKERRNKSHIRSGMKLQRHKTTHDDDKVGAYSVQHFEFDDSLLPLRRLRLRLLRFPDDSFLTLMEPCRPSFFFPPPPISCQSGIVRVHTTTTSCSADQPKLIAGSEKSHRTLMLRAMSFPSRRVVLSFSPMILKSCSLSLFFLLFFHPPAASSLFTVLSRSSKDDGENPFYGDRSNSRHEREM